MQTFEFGLKIGDQITCPICGKSFKVTEDTTAIIDGGYTCSWACFVQRFNERAAEKAQLELQKQMEREERKIAANGAERSEETSSMVQTKKRGRGRPPKLPPVGEI